MLSLLIRFLAEVRGETIKGLVVTVEVGGHGKIDVAAVELRVDLLVDEGLTVRGVVLSDLGVSHLDFSLKTCLPICEEEIERGSCLCR